MQYLQTEGVGSKRWEWHVETNEYEERHERNVENRGGT